MSDLLTEKSKQIQQLFGIRPTEVHNGSLQISRSSDRITVRRWNGESCLQSVNSILNGDCTIWIGLDRWSYKIIKF